MPFGYIWSVSVCVFYIKQFHLFNIQILRPSPICVINVCTDPVLQRVPLGRWVIEDLSRHLHHDLPEEVVPTKHVAVPHRQPHGSSLDLDQWHLVLKQKITNMRQCCYRIKDYCVVTFRISSNMGFSVCFFTFVFLLPALLLSGSK